MRKCYLSIISIILLWSCDKSPNEPLVYDISVYNGYFETLDSVIIESERIFHLEKDSHSISFNLSSGKYPINCYTESGLMFSANILIQGSEESLRIKVDNNGSISID